MTMETDSQDKVTSLLHLWQDRCLSEIASVLKNLKDHPVSTNEQRIQQVLDHLVSGNFLKILSDAPVCSKNAKISADYRDEGNRLFKSNDDAHLDEAFENYTKSIAYAPAGSHELALGFANRSAVLFKGEWFEDCLKDINLALENNNHPDELKAKLYFRKARCLQALKYDQAAVNETFTEAHQWLKKMTKKDQKSMEEMLTHLQIYNSTKNLHCFNLRFDDPPPKLEANPIVSGLSDGVELKYSEEFGRHVVATRDIKPGEIVGAQKPYVNIILATERYKFCWHCGNQAWSSLPCKDCCEVVFCSESCQEKANLDYHDIECSILQNPLMESRTSSLISLRLAILGFKEAGKCLDSFKNNCTRIDNFNDPLKKGFTNNILDPSKFSSTYGLSYHNLSEITESSELLKKSILIAYFFARGVGYLKNESEKNPEILKNDKNFFFLIELIEKAHLISCYNSYGIEIPTLALNMKNVSMAIVPALSLFNHTCNPMTMRHCRGNFVVSTALRPIKQGEQVFECYGPLFHTVAKKERQKYYLDYYNFKCNCEACIDDWPLKLPSKLFVSPELSIESVKKWERDLWIIAMNIQAAEDEVDSCFKKKNQFLNTCETQAEIAQKIEAAYYIFGAKSREYQELARSLEQAIVHSSKRFLFLNMVSRE